MKDEAYYFHQPPVSLCRELLQKLELNPTDCVFDPFAGEGHWIKSFGMEQNIIQTEIENGTDYKNIHLETTKVDWVITHPKEVFPCIEYFAGKTNKGVAVLGKECLCEFTPLRLKNLYEKGIYLHKIVVCSVKKWGNAFFLIFKNKPSKKKPCCSGCGNNKPCEGKEAHNSHDHSHDNSHDHSHDHSPEPEPVEKVRFDFFDFVEGDFE